MVYRRKQGFILQFPEWMKTHLFTHRESQLLSEPSPLDPLFCSLQIKTLWNDFLADRVPWKQPWSIYILKEWARHVDVMV